MEILLHTVVESEASLDDESSSDAENAASVLPTVIEFLDHFDEALGRGSQVREENGDDQMEKTFQYRWKP